MSSSITSYLYENKIMVQILDNDPTIKTRNRIVYSRPLKIYRGVDNVVTVELKNNDQKPITTTGKTFTFVVNEGTAFIETAITITDANAAIGTFTVTSVETDDLVLDQYNYGIKYTDGGLTLPAYVDENWGADGQLEVISSVY